MILQDILAFALYLTYSTGIFLECPVSDGYLIEPHIKSDLFSPEPNKNFIFNTANGSNVIASVSGVVIKFGTVGSAQYIILDAGEGLFIAYYGNMVLGELQEMEFFQQGDVLSKIIKDDSTLELAVWRNQTKVFKEIWFECPESP